MTTHTTPSHRGIPPMDAKRCITPAKCKPGILQWILVLAMFVFDTAIILLVNFGRNRPSGSNQGPGQNDTGTGKSFTSQAISYHDSTGWPAPTEAIGWNLQIVLICALFFAVGLGGVFVLGGCAQQNCDDDVDDCEGQRGSLAGDREAEVAVTNEELRWYGTMAEEGPTM